MIHLSTEEQKMYAEKLMDLANVGAGAMIFGQFLAGAKFSWWLSLGGAAFWVGCFWVSHFIYFSSQKEG